MANLTPIADTAIDPDIAYRAVAGRDTRFDGIFFTAVRSTGIYCRPSCPARTPLRRNVTFYPTSAAAQKAGFRACKKCRPEATPGSPEWDSRSDLAGRAARMIADGVVDREGVGGLASRLGYSERQITRTLVAVLGAGPLALARAQRARTARILIESTALPLTEVAFAAGFASVRQFNDTIREVFDCSPSHLRTRVSPKRRSERLQLRLSYRQPMDPATTLAYLGQRAIAGVETTCGDTYARTMTLPHGAGRMQVKAESDKLLLTLELADLRDLATAVSRTRRLLDLDADPVAVGAALGSQPAGAELLRAAPGLRVPGTVDGFELAARAVIGQQISVVAAGAVLGQLTARFGHDSPFDQSGPERLFPTPSALAGADPASLPMPSARARTLICLAQAAADGHIDLDPGADRTDTRARLLELKGIGPWTADYILMRGLGDPDVLLAGDLAVRRALAARPQLDPRRAAPWLSYLTLHLIRASTHHYKESTS